MIKTQTIVTISNSFRNLIQSQKYEKYVHAIISKSQIIFCGLKFNHIQEQSHGESDFIDDNGRYYDVKLLFNDKQGALIGDPKNEFEKWLQVMLVEKTEFANCIEKRDLDLVTGTSLYRVMKERLLSFNPDENAIFFIPFPIVDENKESIYLRFATDFLQAVYDKLVENGIVGERDTFFIYPSGDPHEYVLRDGSGKREYVKCDELDDFISYEARIIQE